MWTEEVEVLDTVQDFLSNCGRQEQKCAALLCRAYWSAFCIVVCRQKATRIHPFDKILSNTPAARNAIKCQLSVPGLTTHTHTDFLCLPHLKTLLEGRTKEEQGSSQSRGSEPAFSLMTFTENIMGGNREGTEWPAGYSSARIHAFAAWLVHDGRWQLSLCFRGSEMSKVRRCGKWGMCRPRGFVVAWKLDSEFGGETFVHVSNVTTYH